MALANKSLFLYGFQVTPLNSSLDFQNVNAGPQIAATLNVGYYSLTTLMAEIVRAMSVVDTTNTYTVTADRSTLGGTQNRVTVSTSGAFLNLLFSSGARTASSVAPLIGFSKASDNTGATSYTGSSTAGTALFPSWYGNNYTAPTMDKKVFGNVNVSASGIEESIVFQLQQFWSIQFKYIPKSEVENNWQPFFDWVIQKRLIEFTPDITQPNTIYQGTLNSPANGLEHTWKEMLPSMPNFYQTALLKFRVRN